MLVAINSLRLSDAYMRQQTKPPLVQIVACHLFSAKPLPEPVMTYCQLDPWEQSSVKFLLKLRHFHWQNCIWKCWLPSCHSLNVLTVEVWWYLTSAIQLFWVMLFNQRKQIRNHWWSGQHKRNIKALCYWPFVRGIHRWPVDSPHKGPVMRKMFQCCDIIMTWAGTVVTTLWSCTYTEIGLEASRFCSVLDWAHDPDGILLSDWVKILLSIGLSTWPWWHPALWLSQDSAQY